MLLGWLLGVRVGVAQTHGSGHHCSHHGHSSMGEPHHDGNRRVLVGLVSLRNNVLRNLYSSSDGLGIAAHVMGLGQDRLASSSCHL